MPEILKRVVLRLAWNPLRGSFEAGVQVVGGTLTKDRQLANTTIPVSAAAAERQMFTDSTAEAGWTQRTPL